jgi:hypothetical protein
MYVFKEINRSSTLVEHNVVNYTQNLNTSSLGIQSVKVVSGSISSSYWNSLNVLFYTSGSPVYVGEKKFVNPINNFSLNSRIFGTQHLNKFHGYPSQSIFTIPQKYYGESIKKKSFKLTDNSNASSVIIKDDGFGNLYPVDNKISHSTNSPSASDNYVGNIFYDQGMVVVSETSSYSQTPSTASVTFVNNISHSNAFFVSGSDLTTSIKFEIYSGSLPSDTATIKYVESGSSTTITAASASKKLNSVFSGDNYFSASVVGNVVTMSNDANRFTERKPNTTADDLPPLTCSITTLSVKGFGGGKAAINYSDIGTNYTLQFDSVNTITTREYNVTLLPNEFNHSMNYTLRSPISGSLSLSTPYLSKDFTGSNFNPYITTINLYNKNESDTPAIQARLPRPIKKSDKINLVFKIRLDM